MLSAYGRYALASNLMDLVEKRVRECNYSVMESCIWIEEGRKYAAAQGVLESCGDFFDKIDAEVGRRNREMMDRINAVLAKVRAEEG